MEGGGTGQKWDALLRKVWCHRGALAVSLATKVTDNKLSAPAAAGYLITSYALPVR